jgi:hypothetical protein
MVVIKDKIERQKSPWVPTDSQAKQNKSMLFGLFKFNI